MLGWRPWGRHACGIAEVEWDHEHQPVAGRLYYPTAEPGAAAAAGWLSRPLLTARRWLGQGWMPHLNYARGLAAFLCFRLRGRWHTLLRHTLTAIAFLLGKFGARLQLHPGAPLAPGLGAMPLVVFSHGLGGHRFLYSLVCSELASQGYVVLAVEHADGSASAARLPGGRWKFYAGLGDEAAQVAKTRVRVQEMKAALALMQALHRGDAQPGLELTHGLDPASFLRGRLDMRCVAAAGHSYGGATTAALVSEDPLFRCGVTLDPWWPAVFPESQALRRWRTRAPLFVCGSHDWNVPNSFGQLSCGGERQEQILAAAAARREDGERCGGGAMLLCIAGSSHNTYADVLPLFGTPAGWLLERLGLSARLDPVLGIHLCTTSVLAFLSAHLPLTEEQRAAQNWEPHKPDSAPRWAAIAQRDVADSAGGGGGGGGGLFSWLFPGRGLLLGLSDILIDTFLPKPAAFRQVPAGPAHGKAAPAAAAPAPAGQGDEDGGDAGAEWPDDVVTGAEAAETALPSANPASGPHPHAPGARADAPHLAGATQPGAGGVPALPAAWHKALRAAAGRRYHDGVGAEEAEEMAALLGRQHIFKLRVVE